MLGKLLKVLLWLIGIALVLYILFVAAVASLFTYVANHPSPNPASVTGVIVVEEAPVVKTSV